MGGERGPPPRPRSPPPLEQEGVSRPPAPWWASRHRLAEWLLASSQVVSAASPTRTAAHTSAEPTCAA
eukprot:365755-Chlamydomonas_euryale.AAC.2